MVGDVADRCRWQMQGGGGPPVRGMSRSDKGCAVPGEGGKVTSNQEGIYAVAECDDNFSGRAPFVKIKKVPKIRYLLFTKWWERMDIASRGLKTVHRTVLLTPCSNPFLCATKTLPHKFSKNLKIKKTSELPMS